MLSAGARPLTRRQRRRAALASAPGPDASRWSGSAIRAALVWLVAIKVAALVLVFSPALLTSFDLPKAAVSRALAWPMAALVAVALARYGAGILPRTRLHLCVAAIVGATALATLTAENPFVALHGATGRYGGLVATLDLAVLYFATAVAFRGARDWAVAAVTLASAVAASLVYAAIQLLGRDPIHWVSDPRLRPFSTAGNADVYGHLLACASAAALCFFWIEGAYRTADAAPRAPRTFARWRFAALALALVGSAFILVVAARGSAIAVLVGAAVALSVAFTRRGRAPSRRALALGALGALATILVVAVSPVGQRALESAGVIGRLQIYDAVAHAFLARPLLGWGPDSVGVAYPSFRPPGVEALFPQNLAVDQAHDWILQSAATTGLLGLTALVVAVTLFGLVLWRTALPRAPLVAGPILAAYVAYWTNALTSVESVGVSWIPWVAFAAACALVAPADDPPASRRVPDGAVALAVLGSIVLAATGVNALRSDAAALSASNALSASRADVARRAAAESIDLDRGRAEHWELRGQADMLAGDAANAAAAFDEAAGRMPTQTAYWGQLALARSRLAAGGDAGARQAALDAAARAVAADPGLSVSHRVRAEVAAEVGERGLALQEALQAFRLLPSDLANAVTLARIASASPDRAAARAAIDEALRLAQSPESQGVLRQAGGTLGP